MLTKLVRFSRHVVLAFVLVFVHSALAQSVPAEAQRGLAWLGSQVQSDGTLAGEEASVATSTQSRSETLQTLAMFASGAPSVARSMDADTDAATEHVARRAIALAATGATVTTLTQSLRARQNDDGGFGAYPDESSNALDTALTLMALRAAGGTRDAAIERALVYLGGAHNTDGTYGNGVPAYVSSYALIAFSLYSKDYATVSAVLRTQNALVALQTSGAYSDSLQNAVAAIAFVGSRAAAATSAAQIAALKTAQSANGSWGDDVFVTALAVRAIAQAAAAPAVAGAEITGLVIDGTTNLPLSGALARTAGGVVSPSTDASGRFVVSGAAAGSYAVTIERPGYLSQQVIITAVDGHTVDAGSVTLQPHAGRSILRGLVTDASNGATLANVLITAGGQSTLSGSDGHFELVDLAAGATPFRAERAGYETITGSVTLVVATANYVSPALNPTGTTPTIGATLRGRVLDADTGAAIAGAQVATGSASSLSGTDGGFTIENLTAGAFTAQVVASGYGAATLSGTLLDGVNDAGDVRLRAAQPATASTLVGRVTSAATQQPIPGATVAIDGVTRATTDADGAYRVENVVELSFELEVSATGFVQRVEPITVGAFATHSINVALATFVNPNPANTYQIVSFGAPSSVAPGDGVTIAARVANLGTASGNVQIITRIEDAQGVAQRELCGSTAESSGVSCEVTLAAESTRDWSAAWTVPNLTAGNYSATLIVVEPGTASMERPLGNVLARASAPIAIAGRAAIGGGASAMPPAVMPNSATGVDLTALVQNEGNMPLPSGTAVLRVLDAQGTEALRREAVLEGLAPSGIGALDFGNWKPQTAGEYALVVTMADSAIPGQLSGSLYVGDAAVASFTVNPHTVGDGTQTVRGQIDVTGIDATTGVASDPLLARVRQAIQRGADYSGPEAIAWQDKRTCTGCHVQTQTLFGLSRSMDKANINPAHVQYLLNSQMSTRNSDGRIASGHYEVWDQQQTTLAMWSLGAWPDRAYTLETRANAALHMHRNRTVNGNLVSWPVRSDFYGQGYFFDPQLTAFTIKGMADVLRDYEELQPTTIAKSQLRTIGTLPEGMEPVDMFIRQDGAAFVLVKGGNVYRIDMATGAATLHRTNRSTGEYTALVVNDAGDVYASRNTGFGGIYKMTASATTWFYQHVAPRDLDMTADGRVVAIAGGLLEILPDGITKLRTFGNAVSGFPIGIEALPDGTLLSLYSNDIYLVNSATSGQYLTSSTVQPNEDIVRTPDGQTYLVHEPIDPHETNDGGGLLRIDADGFAQRVITGAGLRDLENFGNRIFTLDVASRSLVELETVTAAPADVSALRADFEPAARYLLSQPAPPDSQNARNAFTLIGLAEGREFIANTALRGQVDAKITALAAGLRSRQNADGGWGRYHFHASDNFTTALVGLALEYMDLAPDDPVLRKSVDYLLSKQQPDGAWKDDAISYYFTASNNLAATSFVMAYLPAAFERLGGVDTDLAVTLPAGAVFTNPTLATTATTNTDGTVTHVVDLGRVGSESLDFDFDVTLHNLAPGETRPAAVAAELRFKNGFTGELVKAPIGVPAVTVREDMTMTLALDKSELHATDVLTIAPTLTNAGSTITGGTLRYSIEGADGALVARLDDASFAGLVSGSARTLPATWNSGSTLTGAYIARVQLYSPAGALRAEATAPFAIVAGDGGTNPTIDAVVATDRQEYDAGQTATITGRVFNRATNATVEGLALREVVRAASGDVVFDERQSLGQLLPAAFATRTFAVALGNAAPGQYTVEQTVLDANAAIVDMRSASFRVRSASETGNGLYGTLTAAPTSIETGDSLVLEALAGNRSNADFAALPLVLSVVDLATERVLWTTESPANIARDATVTLNRTWDSTGMAPGAYIAVLSARVGEASVTLAHTPVTLTQPVLVVASTLATDRAQYDANDTVTITGVVTNESRIAVAAGLVLNEVVRNASGDIVMEAMQQVDTLTPASAGSYAFTLPLGTKAPGDYTVEQTLTATDATVLDTRTASFVVRSTADTGVGLSGALTATPATVEAGADVDLAGSITNAGNADVPGLPVTLSIVATDGSVVMSAESLVDSLRGTTTAVARVWTTAGVAAGNYTATLSIRIGATVTQLASATIVVTAPVLVLDGSVEVDSAQYDANEIVTITGRVTNTSRYAVGESLSLHEVVRNSAGESVFDASRPLPVLAPAAAETLSFSYALGTVTPGTYAVEQTVTNGAATILDTRATSFVVRSTAQSGVGLFGELVATPDSVDSGEPVTLDALVGNRGNADVPGLPVTLSVTDATGAVVWTYETLVDARRDATVPLTQVWPTAGLAGGTYTASLATRVASGALTLAQTSITVIESVQIDVAVTQEITNDNRVLVLASCRNSSGAIVPTCEQLRVAFLDAYLVALGVEHTIVTSEADFRRHFRSGRYNTYWISGGAEKLANSLAEELREAVLRGDGLLVEGAHDARNQTLDEALGIKHNGKLSGTQSITFGQGLFTPATIATVGDAVRYDTRGASVEAAFGGGAPAVLRNAYGRGHAITFAFDLSATLQAAETDVAWQERVDAALAALLADAPEQHAAGGFLSLSTVVENTGRAVDVEVVVQLPTGFRVESTNPVGTVTGQLIRWMAALPEGETRILDAALRLPTIAGTYPVTTTVYATIGGTRQQIDSTTMQIVVVDAAATQTAVLDAVRALAPTKANERSARDQAITALDTAKALVAAGNFEAAIVEVLKARDRVAGITSVDTAGCRLGIARVLRDAELAWHAAQ